MEDRETKITSTPKTSTDMTVVERELKERFMEEIGDSNDYLNMANIARSEGCVSLAKGLCAIAWDEFTHAKFIYEHLIDSGYDIPENELMKWHELKERIKRKFCNG